MSLTDPCLAIYLAKVIILSMSSEHGMVKKAVVLLGPLTRAKPPSYRFDDEKRCKIYVCGCYRQFRAGSGQGQVSLGRYTIPKDHGSRRDRGINHWQLTLVGL